MVGVGLHSPVLYQFDISFDEKTEAHSGKRNLQRLYSWGIGTHIFWVHIQYSFCCASVDAPVESDISSDSTEMGYMRESNCKKH